MAPIRGLNLLPPKVSIKQALEIYELISRVNLNIGKLNATIRHSIVSSNMIEAFSFQESVQSTRIEGTQVTFSDIIDEAAKKKKSSEVQEVINYRNALNLGVDLIKGDNPISSRVIKLIHSELMEQDARGTVSSKGEFRKVQNYIGPEGCNETNASYIPVVASDIGNYMTNLEYYINSTEHRSFEIEKGQDEVIFDEKSAGLLKLAVMHAQFESIHPFLDGNGRTGRILIVLHAIKEKLVDEPVFFISEELEKEKIRYYNNLNGIRGDQPDWFSWIKFFLEASERTVNNMLSMLSEGEKLSVEGIGKLRKVKKGHLIQTWLLTFNNGYVQVNKIAKVLQITPTTARKYLNELVELNMLDVDKSKSKNKIYVNYNILRLIQN